MTYKDKWMDKNREHWKTHDPREEKPLKTCTKCCIEKSTQQFDFSYREKDGLGSWCKSCVSQYTADTLPARMVYQAKWRAKKKGLDFDITVNDISIPETCPVLGIPIHRGKNKLQAYGSPTIDRMDCSKGYVKGNVRVISHRANSLKSNASVSELRAVLVDLESLKSGS